MGEQILKVIVEGMSNKMHAYFYLSRKRFPSSADSRRTSCQLLAKEWTLNTGKLAPGGLFRNNVVK